MNSEESRLRTFAKWPEDAVVDARRIAKAGFYYMGQGLEVQCFSCGGRIAEWNYGDKVMAKHISLDPRCPFVVNPLNSGNIPMTNSFRRSSSNRQEVSNHARSINRSVISPYTSKEFRMATFNTWPICAIVQPSKLAESGFYFTQIDDKVQCAYCDGIVGNWELGDDPDMEHQRHFPACPYVTKRNNSTNHVDVRDSKIEATNLDNMKEIGVLSHKVPTNPKYSTCEARLRTFTDWPSTVLQKPEELADAGFYYSGIRDQVRCFHCDGGLRSWEPDDVPWLEHAKWFSDCGFVSLTKGQEFIDGAIKSLRPAINRVEKSLDSIHQCVNRKNYTVTEEELQELMNSPQALAALQVGIEASRVKQAIKFNKTATGENFKNADDLIVAALDIQTEESSSSDLQDYWSTPPMSPVFRSRCMNPRAVVTPVATDESDEETEEYSLNPTVTQKEVYSMETASAEPTKINLPNSNLSLEEENRRLKEARLCKICMDSEVEIVLLPCGHLVTCINCSYSLTDCPLCRQDIKATVRTFLS